MPKYTIQLDYRTGDTNGSYDSQTEVGEWENLERAKESLKRIHEHYDWFRCRKSGFCYHHFHNPCPQEPEWHKNMKLPKHSYEQQREYYVELVNDDGSPNVYGAYTWCGYFESLYGGRVVALEGTDGMSFKV